MLIGYEMFLLAAEELNFSRAAERAFVTPQCLSDHIKRLEAHHHVTLFRRRPHLELTAEGAAMLRYLSRIKALEYRMKNELADISQGTRGTIRLGIPTTRGTILVPSMVPEFQKQYPNVDVQVRLNDTHKLEDLLLSGEIDLFLGVDAKEHPLFDKIELERETLYLVVPVLRFFPQPPWPLLLPLCQHSFRRLVVLDLLSLRSPYVLPIFHQFYS